jgi:hypothetical protein
MVSDRALDDFRMQRALGVSRPQLHAFDPPGAFDAMPARLRKGARDQEGELPAHISKQLDVISDSSARQLLSHLKRRFAHDEEEADDHQARDADVGNPGIVSEVVDFLRDCGIDPKICQRVEQMLDAGNSDGTLRISHDDEGPAGGPSSGYDPTGESPGFGQDQPPPFRGAPQAPYTSPGDAERHAALENMKRIKSLTPGDLAYKDGVPFTGTMPNGDQFIHGALLRRPARDTLTHEGRHGSTLAMDAASAEGFFTRFPDARRIRIL